MSNRNITQSSMTPVSTSAGPGSVGTSFVLQSTGGNSPSYALRENKYDYLMHYRQDSILRWMFSPPNNTVYTGTMYNLGILPSWTSTWDNNRELDLIAKVVQKIKRHSFNAAVAAAEASQTLGMIGNTATRIDRALRYTVKGDMRRAARALGARRPRKVHQDVASNWLELQYGWLPLLNDVHAAAEALAQDFSRRFTQSYKVRRLEKWALTPSAVINYSYLDKRTYHQLIVRFSQDMSKAQSMGLLEPEMVLWEKLPYSFVIDWFTPIGTWLEVMGTLGWIHGLEFVRTKYTVEQFNTPRSGPAGGFRIVEVGSHRSKTVTVERRTGSQLAIPYPEVRSLSDAMNWKRTANSLALLAQRKTKLPGSLRR